MRFKLTIKFEFHNTRRRREIHVNSYYGATREEAERKAQGFVAWKNASGWELTSSEVLVAEEV